MVPAICRFRTAAMLVPGRHSGGWVPPAKQFTGLWPGPPDASTRFPTGMLVQSIKVWEWK